MLIFYTLLVFLLGGSAFAGTSDKLIEEALQKRIILCTGPSLDRKELLIKNTEKDMSLIPFKKVFLSTNDPKNLKVTFKGKRPVVEFLQNRGKQLDCLNCIISSIRNAVNDPDVKDDDILLFKHESVYISDMKLVKKAIGKILDGYDIVIKYWIGFEQKEKGPRLNDYYHSDSFFLKVSAARSLFKNRPLVTAFNDDYQFCEEYLTKHIVNKLPKVFKLDYHHSSWKDNELGFYHEPRGYEPPEWYWDKNNYHQLYN